MRNLALTMPLFSIVTALGLSACGSGGTTGVASAPPPPTGSPPPPPPPGQLLYTGGVSQQFASLGATYPASIGQIAGGAGVPAPLLDDPDQLRLRYDAASNTYEVQLPQAQSWLAIQPDAGGQGHWSSADGSVLLIQAGGSSSAALVRWNGPNSFGAVGIGTPTPTSNVPRTGWAMYYGSIAGYSSEKFASAPGTVGGQIHLMLSFGSGTLSGTAFPTLTLGQVYTLPTLNVASSVRAVGSPGFSGTFATTLPGVNLFSGSMVGLTGRDVMGSLAFPYSSPVTGTPQQAAGGFAGHVRASCC